jgi:hypothetical protein
MPDESAWGPPKHDLEENVQWKDTRLPGQVFEINVNVFERLPGWLIGDV